MTWNDVMHDNVDPINQAAAMLETPVVKPPWSERPSAFRYNHAAALPGRNHMKPTKPQAIALSLLFLFAHALPAAAQDPNAGRNLAANCFTCHGTNGNSVEGVPPGLAGRDRAELFQTMKDFQSGKRPATIMHQQAKGYTDQQLQLIAAYLAAQKPAPVRTPSKAGY
jgi:sulfide dehydrogenase cytochrome subunit